MPRIISRLLNFFRGDLHNALPLVYRKFLGTLPRNVLMHKQGLKTSSQKFVGTFLGSVSRHNVLGKIYWQMTSECVRWESDLGLVSVGEVWEPYFG